MHTRKRRGGNFSQFSRSQNVKNASNVRKCLFLGYRYSESAWLQASIIFGSGETSTCSCTPSQLLVAMNVLLASRRNTVIKLAFHENIAVFIILLESSCLLCAPFPLPAIASPLCKWHCQHIGKDTGQRKLVHQHPRGNHLPRRFVTENLFVF